LLRALKLPPAARNVAMEGMSGRDVWLERIAEELVALEKIEPFADREERASGRIA